MDFYICHLIFIVFFITGKMASNQDDTHDASGSGNNVEKEITRGLTIMKSIICARDKGIKHDPHDARREIVELKKK